MTILAILPHAPNKFSQTVFARIRVGSGIKTQT